MYLSITLFTLAVYTESKSGDEMLTWSYFCETKISIPCNRVIFCTVRNFTFNDSLFELVISTISKLGSALSLYFWQKGYVQHCTCCVLYGPFCVHTLNCSLR